MAGRIDGLQAVVNRSMDAQLAQQAAVRAPEEGQKQLSKELQEVLLAREARTEAARRAERERVHDRQGRNAQRQEPQAQQEAASEEEQPPDEPESPARPPGGAPSLPLLDGVGGLLDIRI